ncbi:TPA: DNA-protecting protein DprA [Candidatus Poribacteria bacterium]|nr:DNA-protecting protein DprA [Candidatus Poribacteria bacterium]HEX28927.1 DNA-protecting protein DprA [Candidatus Poribacteria bacterium]
MCLSPEHRALIHLSLIPGIGNAVIRRLKENFGSVQAGLEASEGELKGVLPPRIYGKLLRGRSSKPILRRLEREIELVGEMKCRTVAFGEEGYPSNLVHIYDPPPILFIKGELNPDDKFAVSVVGTRRATTYGRDVCSKLTREIVQQGFTIVSGMARGIDTVAHRSALESGGRTIAVLGSGLSNIYPRENTKLAEEISRNGALISEFPMTTPPVDVNFPRRNRIISGLSLATIVVEADERSGALITADFALEQGREVLAVPGSIFSRCSRGTHRLIKEGAALMESVDDLLNALNIPRAEKPEQEVPAQEKIPVDLEDEEKMVLDVIPFTPIHIDEISASVNMPPNKVSSILLMLELKGLVGQQPGKMFVRRSLRRG